jgi:hypothetical protein
MPLRNRVQAGDGVVQLLREGRVFGQLAQRAFAGVDLGHHLIGVGDGGVQVVVERVVFEQLARAALALVQGDGDLFSRSTAELARV